MQNNVLHRFYNIFIRQISFSSFTIHKIIERKFHYNLLFNHHMIKFIKIYNIIHFKLLFKNTFLYFLCMLKSVAKSLKNVVQEIALSNA